MTGAESVGGVADEVFFVLLEAALLVVLSEAGPSKVFRSSSLSRAYPDLRFCGMIEMVADGKMKDEQSACGRVEI